MGKSRLASRAFPASVVRSLQVEGVHRLSGMDKALVEHGLVDVPRKEGEYDFVYLFMRYEILTVSVVPSS